MLSHSWVSGCLLGYEQAMFEQDGEVDEVANSGVLAFTEVAEHAVELLCRVPVDVDRFDLNCWDAGESQRIGYGELVSGVKFMGPGGHVELDASERLCPYVKAEPARVSGDPPAGMEQGADRRFRWSAP